MSEKEKRDLMLWALSHSKSGNIQGAVINKDGENVLVPDGNHVRLSDQCFVSSEEVMGLLKELADKAPEGAEFYWIYGEEDNYMKGKDSNPMYFQDGKWKESDFPWSSYEGLIPLPNAEPEKWMPEVGQECECFMATDHSPRLDGWVWCIIVGRLTNGAIVIELNDGSFDSVYEKSKFRPLKTEAEKERDRLAVELFVELTNSNLSTDDIKTTPLYKDCLRAIDAGWRPQK